MSPCRPEVGWVDVIVGSDEGYAGGPIVDEIGCFGRIEDDVGEGVMGG